MSQRIYVDNAATSFPKPPEVYEAMRDYATTLGASAGRGAYREAVEVGDMLTDTRYRLMKLINGESHDAVVFTHNCSAALNLAIHGLLREGDHVVTTTVEHNSVLRPLHAQLADKRITVTWIDPDREAGIVDPQKIAEAISPNTRLVAMIHASNVTGAIQPVAQVGAICRDRDCTFLVDAAQTIGHVPIEVRDMRIDLLAMPGHKGLMGPLGTGALYIRPGLEKSLRPLLQGGTGSISDQPEQPEFMPDRFEPGSQNAIGIAGLHAALKWLESKSVSRLCEHDRHLSQRFLERIIGIESVTLYGPQTFKDRVAVFSVRIDGLEPGELSALLESEFGILTRPGIHCAPFTHRGLGTDTFGGTVRLSFGAFNTTNDVDACTAALREIAANASTPAKA